MRIRRDRLRKKTFHHIEQELFHYTDTKKEVAQIRELILHRTRPDDNPGSSRSSLPGNPTANMAVTLADNKLLDTMQEIVNAVDTVYYGSNNTVRKFMDEFYFARPRTLTIDGVADKMYISRRTLYRIRHRLVQKLAIELGWW